MADPEERRAGPPGGDAPLLEESAEDLYENAPCGYLSALPDGTIVKVNETFLSWTGYRREDLIHARRFQDLLSAGGRIFHETHYAPLLRMQGAVREIAVDIVRADGSELPALINSVLRFDAAGQPQVTRTTVFNATDRKAYERELVRAQRMERTARERTEHLQRLTSALSAGLLPEEIAERLVDELMAASGARYGTVALVTDGEVMEPLASHGFDASPAPVPQSVEPVFLESLDPPEAISPLPTGAAAGILPLHVNDRVIGVAALGFEQPRPFSADERAFLLACAAQAAQALERARLHAQTAAAARRSTFIAETMHSLISVTATGERAERLAGALVPAFADAAQVQFTAGGDAPPIVASAGAGRGWAAADDIARRTMATGRLHVGTLGDGGDACAALPLGSNAPPQGVLTVLRAAEAPFEAEELGFLADLAERSALALENARLYEYERGVAHTLQQSLLADEGVDDPRLAVATRYTPAVETLEVGGDWHDTFSIDDDRIAVVVGDVVGRGIEAATAMGQLRSATRALALATRGPAELVTRLDAFVDQMHAGSAATLVYVELDLRDGGLRYACAGHPPPVLLPDAGPAEFLWGGRSAPLGAAFGPDPRAEASGTLPAGARLLLYTDGLVERRDRPLDRGLDALATEFEARRQEPLWAVVAGLADAMLLSEHGDDVCLLCLSFLGAERERRTRATSLAGRRGS